MPTWRRLHQYRQVQSLRTFQFFISTNFVQTCKITPKKWQSTFTVTVTVTSILLPVPKNGALNCKTLAIPDKFKNRFWKLLSDKAFLNLDTHHFHQRGASSAIGVCGSTISTRPVPVADDANRARPASKISTYTRADPRVYRYP